VIYPSQHPSLEELLDLFRRLTGREPTPEDVEREKRTLEEWDKGQPPPGAHP
jgi:hypothetical protein